MKAAARQAATKNEMAGMNREKKNMMKRQNMKRR